jgi:GntR family transcriptional regulator/MocR family aminotransferase
VPDDPDVHFSRRSEKLLADRGSSRIQQHGFPDFPVRGELDRHLRRMLAGYHERRDTLIDALTAVLPEATVAGVAAGLHVTLQLPDSDDEQAIVEEAQRRRRHIRLETLGSFQPGTRRPPTLLLGYGQLPTHAIRSGVEELGAAVQATRSRVNRMGGH